MFHYNYIVPTGPAGYYNYSNQQSNQTSSAPSQTYTPPQSQAYTPPQSSSGTAHDYYGTSQTQGNTTDALAQLVPAQVDVYSPRANPRLTQIYQEFDQYMARPIPDHETRYIATLKDFNKWMDGVYHPKMRALTELRSSGEALQQKLYNFAEGSCRLGTEAHKFLTENLEIGDVFDIMSAVETRLEEIYDALLSMDELKINIESDANAADCYKNNKIKYAQQWESYKETTTTTARRNFHQARCVRKRAHFEKLTHYVTTADQIDTPPYEAIMSAIAQIQTLNSDHDMGVLTRASVVLRKALNQGIQIDAYRYQAQSDVQYCEEVALPWVDAPYTQQDALLERQRQIVANVQAQCEQHKQAVEAHYVQWAQTPIARLMDAFRSSQGVQLQHAPPPAYAQQQAVQTYNAAPATSATPATAQAAPSTAQGGGGSGKFQMPLSWYSNMLTQSHVTNMQIANNVGGGSTTFHYANPAGNIIY